MKLCWLIPDDRGGGVVSVAISCVRQARAAGHDAVLLLLLEPTGWLAGETGLRIASSGLRESGPEASRALLRWLSKNPQDVVVINGCEEADVIIPFLPPTVHCVYVVHDTAPRFWQAAVAGEQDLAGIVAVSRTVAREFAHHLKSPAKLHIIPNGSVFPPAPDLNAPRPDDFLFLGGGNPTKGAHDVLRLWPRLLEGGFTGRLHWLGELDSAWERRIIALPEAGRIQRPGRRPREAVFATAGACKVLLMLSRVEPFGMATIEAMSMGCVPVAWDIETGTKEIVTGKETGYFAPLGDTAALTALVARACADHARLAPKAARRAREVFGEEIMWRGYEDLLEVIRHQPAVQRARVGQAPPDFTRPRRRFQFLSAPVRAAVRDFVGRSPRLGYWLRDLRGR